MKPTTTIERISVAKARQLLDQNNNNRPISQRNLESIISAMKNRDFHLTGESIKIAENGDLLDGQHRLLAIIESGVELEIPVIRGLDNKAFKYIDTGKKRIASDVLAIEGYQSPTKLAAMIKFIIAFKKGAYFALINNDARPTSKGDRGITNAEVSEFAHKNKVALLESCPYGYSKENKLLNGATLSSLHYIFNQIDPTMADDFCWKVAKGEDLTKSSPIYLLRQKLIGDMRSTRKMSRLERLALICKAWNLYRKNKSVTILKWDNLKEPFPKPI